MEVRIPWSIKSSLLIYTIPANSSPKVLTFESTVDPKYNIEAINFKCDLYFVIVLYEITWGIKISKPWVSF